MYPKYRKPNIYWKERDWKTQPQQVVPLILLADGGPLKSAGLVRGKKTSHQLHKQKGVFRCWKSITPINLGIAHWLRLCSATEVTHSDACILWNCASPPSKNIFLEHSMTSAIFTDIIVPPPHPILPESHVFDVHVHFHLRCGNFYAPGRTLSSYNWK